MLVLFQTLVRAKHYSTILNSFTMNHCQKASLHITNQSKRAEAWSECRWEGEGQVRPPLVSPSVQTSCQHREQNNSNVQIVIHSMLARIVDPLCSYFLGMAVNGLSSDTLVCVSAAPDWRFVSLVWASCCPLRGMKRFDKEIHNTISFCVKNIQHHMQQDGCS